MVDGGAVYAMRLWRGANVVIVWSFVSMMRSLRICIAVSMLSFGEFLTLVCSTSLPTGLT